MEQINKYITDIIKEDDYKSWNNNESVFIDSQTGSGKTYFILNILSKYALSKNQTILYLCNRTQLYKKVIRLVNEGSITNVYVMTYQKLQEQIKNNIEIAHFDYLVSDESHFFLSDADFALETDISFDFVKNAKECVKIFMSATGENLKNILISENLLSEDKCYSLPTSYDYVENLYFFKRRGHLEIIRYLLKNNSDKIVYFCSSNDKFVEAVKEFGDVSNHICSIHTKNKVMQDLNQPDCIEANGDYTTFPQRLLITTRVMDCGVDLIDPQIKHLICDISDLESCKQCIGRKRIINNMDTVTLYIRDYSSNELILNLQYKQEKLEPIDLFLHNMDSFIEKYDKREMYYGFYVAWSGNQTPYINMLQYKKLMFDVDLLKEAIRISYKKLFTKFMGGEIELKTVEIPFASVVGKEKLLEFLEENKDKELSKPEKENLINIINLRDNQGRQLKTIGLLNSYFIECHIDYTILSRRKSDPKRTFYWIIR